MPDVASVLRDEIRRLARKEIKSATSTQSKQVRDLKNVVRALRREVASLQKELSASRRSAAAANGQSAGKEEENKAIRLSPKSIRNHRKRLKLSQAQLGQLLGVSTTTVVFWESGRTAPRGSNRHALAEVRTLGKKDAQALLGAV
tara:strand:- start:46 stop:480 length:435 start_codon:yes stop_codon:yes gene_type:complete